MPRKFTLAGLMIGVALFCVVCGMWVNVPFLFDPFVALIFGVPVVTVTLILCCFSKQRELLAFNAAAGAIFGFALLPAIGPLLRPEHGDFESPDLSLLLPAMGAMVLGGIFLVVELRESRCRHRQSVSPDQPQ